MNNVFDKERRKIYFDLKQIGLEEKEAWAEADIILEHVTGTKRTKQITSDIKHFDSNWTHKINRIINDRRERKPLAYCLGEVEFAGLMLRIIPGILIPRPDTETLVKTIIDRLHKNEAGRLSSTPTTKYTVSTNHVVGADVISPQKSGDIPPEHDSIRIAEIGVGSGAVSIALLKQIPNCTVWACDISDLAINCALGNARQHNVADRLTLVHSDWKKVLPQDFDIIVSNPPYLPNSAQHNLQPEIAFEPKSALFDGTEDGLSFYREFAEKLPTHFAQVAGSREPRPCQASPLQETGDQHLVGAGIHTRPCSPFAAFEIGDKQDQAVLEILNLHGWQNLNVKNDINNLPRVILASV